MDKWRELKREEAEDFFATFYRGKHHIPGERVREEGPAFYVNHPATGPGLSSFDYDDLTRLVFLAHDRAIRVAITASNPRHVRILIAGQRTRPPGDMALVHPTIEQALDKWRKDPNGCWWPLLAEPKLEPPRDFDHAEFYSCREPDRLTLESPEEAIAEYLAKSPQCDMRELIAQHSPITVTGYVPSKVRPTSATTYAKALGERLQELWEDNYGDPDGDVTSMPVEAVEAFAAEIVPAIERAFAKSRVWHCDEAGSRTYSAEEVTALMREHCPEWFEEIEEAVDGELRKADR